MAYKMHLPLGTGYLRGSVFICHTAPECHCLHHSGFHPMGGMLPHTPNPPVFHPKYPTIYSTNYYVEKTLMTKINLEWSKMASDTTLYNLKTQIFPGGEYPHADPLLIYPYATTYIHMYPHLLISLHCMCLYRHLGCHVCTHLPPSIGPMIIIQNQRRTAP